jgi:hypothetical protein
MSYQLYPPHHAQHFIFKCTLAYVLDVHSLNMRACLRQKPCASPASTKRRPVQVAAARRRLAKSGPRRNQRSGGALVACHRGYAFAAEIRSDSFRFHLAQRDQARLPGRLDFPENQAVL